MVKNGSVTKVMIIFLAITLVSGTSFVNFNIAYATTILSPADGSSFPVGISISFSGTDADDIDDIEWSSDIDGIIGTSSPVSTSSLSVGTHLITMTDTDEGGSDTITITITPAGDCDGHPATIVGTSGDDVIVGTSGDDVILGLAGDDIINGNGGNDIVCSGSGNDIVTLGSGNDEIHGEGGFDTFDAGDGVNMIDADFGNEGDTVTTGSDDDYILLGDGDDIVNAGGGNNYIETGAGDDTITSGSGNDEIHSGSGNDTITSGNGNDQIYGGNGKDTISSIDGDNYVEGNNNDDEITTGPGVDTILGGNGDDCINSGGQAGDSIDGGSGANLINTGSCDNPPTVSITSPVNSSSTIIGTSVTFTGTANDVEDGNLDTSLFWISDLDGAIGAGDTFSTSTLSIGAHMITASVTDSFGNTATHTHLITVNPIGTPTLSISEPADSFVSIEGSSLTFSASATDPEDGGLSNLISWTSDIDGSIGVGSSFSMSTLSVGTHTITATVSDSDFNTSTISISITIGAIVEEATTLVCHFPPGNPANYHEIMIGPSALIAHKSHGDTVGKCFDDDVTEKKIENIKNQKTERGN